MDNTLARVIADMLAPQIAEAVKTAIRENPDTRAAPVTIYTVDEAAKLLRTSREQILAFIRCGKLPSFKLERDSRRNLIHATDLMDFVDRLKNAG